ncbi:ABC transporter family protein [Haloactinospora alba]|uniref:ABC transporter family protein n=1 Tax=Haloactinospora alba TaxID=405555 RepID=A0A543NLP8_9ACTN|nr:ATP-binding cassette domain-containing protein [Haloactinospora alba]TQN32727.1 ABC transporter family protein [Haloactinospora alba]
MRRATGARVEANGLALRTRQGPVYAGVTFTALPGSLTAFHATSGSGRTSLLLSLAGRMRPSHGSLHVDGHPVPASARRVRRVSALGLFDGVNDLDERLRVTEHLSERTHLRLRPAGRSQHRAALSDADLPDVDTRALVRDLSMVEKRRLGVALALLEEPRLLLVDNADHGLTPDEQADFARTLGKLADAGLTVVASCTDATAFQDRATTIPLTRGARPPSAEPSEPSGRHRRFGAGSLLPGRRRVPRRTPETEQEAPERDTGEQAPAPRKEHT